MIKLGTYLVRGAGLTPEERLRIIKAAGFDFVCLDMKAMLAGEQTGLTPELCGRVGIDFDNVHLTGSGTHAVWAEGERGDKIVERYCKEIKLCAEYGIKTGITHVTWGTSEPPPVCELGLRRFRTIAECAEKYGVVVALENSVSREHLYYVLDNIKSPYVGHCFDSGHRNAFAHDTDFLAKYGDRLVATHIQDNDAKHDLHLMPFDGTINWEQVSAELAGTSYARKQICAEVAGSKHWEREGMTAEQIRESMAHVSAEKQGLITYEDGAFTTYVGFTYEQLIDRLYSAMTKIANMIEDAK